jgi:protein TonB
MQRLPDAFILWLALASSLHAALPLLLGRQAILTPPAPPSPPVQEIGITLVEEQSPQPEPEPEPEPEPPLPPEPSEPPETAEENPTMPEPHPEPEIEPDKPPEVVEKPKPKPAPAPPPPKPRPKPAAAPKTAPAPVSKLSRSTASTVAARLARARYAPQPRYPSDLRRAGVEGSLIVLLRISEKGRVLGASVWRSSGHRAFDQAALEALRKWRFDPARNASGHQVPSTLKAPVQYRLKR